MERISRCKHETDNILTYDYEPINRTGHDLDLFGQQNMPLSPLLHLPLHAYEMDGSVIPSES